MVSKYRKVYHRIF